jgi:hypothetical protein
MKPEQPNPDDEAPPAMDASELLEWARRTFDEEKFLAELREMREQGGGLELKGFIHEIKAAAGTN